MTSDTLKSYAFEDGSFTCYECLKHFAVASVKHRDEEPAYSIAKPGDFIIVNQQLMIAIMSSAELKQYLTAPKEQR